MWLKFKKDTVYKGVGYGPTCPDQCCDVDRPWSNTFVVQSRAEPMTKEEIAEHKKGARGTRGLPGSTTREARSAPPVQCEGKTKKGDRCKAQALAGTKLCRTHTEE